MSLNFLHTKSMFFLVFKKVIHWYDTVNLKFCASISIVSDFHLTFTQPTFTCSKSTIEIPEQCVKSVQSYQ